MLSVNEGVLQSEEVMVVVFVKLCVELEKPVSIFESDAFLKPLLTRSSTDTSIMLWLKYAVLFLTTFTATTSCVFKFWHLTT